MSQQYKQLEDRISWLESDLAQLQQLVAGFVKSAEEALKRDMEAALVEVRRGPGRPKKEQQ